MMKKTVLSFWLSMLILSAQAGTLIITNADGKERILSNVTIESIANGQMVIQMRQGRETILLASVKRFYDTNIKASGDFEDNTAAYSVRLTVPEIRNRKIPRKGGGQSKESLTFSFEYNLDPVKGSKMSASVREPYFYLYVLSSEPDGSRRFSVFSYPKDAQISGKRYDEAKMLEKVISLDRKKVFPGDLNKISHSDTPRGDFGTTAVHIPLTRIDSAGEILAWHLIAWGKDSILQEKDWKHTSFRLHKNWWQTAGE